MAFALEIQTLGEMHLWATASHPRPSTAVQCSLACGVTCNMCNVSSATALDLKIKLWISELLQ